MKRSKYGAKKTTVNGINFSSQKEARRYSELLILEMAGKIRDLNLQVPFIFELNGAPIKFASGRKLTYVADFVYFINGADHFADVRKMVVEDSKGMKLPVYKIKKALMKAFHGIDIIET